MSLFESASLVVTPNGTKESKLYAIKPTDGSGDLVVTRETTATRVNSAGLIESVAVNVPRLDYTNSTCPSILVEPQRTNLFTYSEQFDNTDWAKVNTSITANSSISPDGNNTADKIIENTNTSDHAFYQYQNFTSGTTYTVSFYAKKAERTKIRLTSAATSQTPSADFDLNAMTANAIASSFNASIVNVGNGWVKCSVSKTANTTTFDLIYFAMVESFASNSYAGDGTSGLYLWGAQLEEGSYATSYIPTVASTVTRNADVISKTGISSLIGQTEGTIFIDLVINNLDFETGVFGVQKISTNSTIRIGSGSGGLQNLFAQCFNGSSNLFFEVTPYTLGSRVKIAFSYKAGSYAFYINGVQIATGTNATTMPTCDDFFFAKNFALGNNTAAKINSTLLYKTRLSNTELATLTTI